MFGLLDWIKFGVPVVVGALVGGAIFYQVGHWRGDSAGRAAERSAALERSIELIKERNSTDAEISKMDDRQLCAALGGRMSDEGLCE